MEVLCSKGVGNFFVLMIIVITSMSECSIIGNGISTSLLLVLYKQRKSSMVAVIGSVRSRFGAVVTNRSSRALCLLYC